jgi:elongation factor G
MKEIATKDLRNLAVIGHSACGKTSLCEALLFTAGAIKTLGNVQSGSTVTDFEPEEVTRQKSLSTGFATLPWKKHGLHLVDTPGDANFIAEARSCLQVLDGALLVVSAVGGIETQTERTWSFAREFGVATVIFVNMIDRDNANFAKALSGIGDGLGAKPVPLQIPIGSGEDFKGVIDLAEMKALTYAGDGSGKFKAEEIPEDLSAEAQAARKELLESIAESNDDLLETYLEREDLTPEEIDRGLAKAVRDGAFVPVGCGSAAKNIGMGPLLDLLVRALPSPESAGSRKGLAPKGKEEAIERAPSETEPFSAVVFKTLVDPFAGTLSVMRIVSGKLGGDLQARNVNRDHRERLSHPLWLQGKKQHAAEEAGPGDLVAVAKLKDTHTSDTLSDDKSPIQYPFLAPPRGVIAYAIGAKSKQDEDKVHSSLHRLIEEDPTLHLDRDAQTKEALLSGMGQQHIEVTVEKLKRKFGVEVVLKTPKVPYKETIKGKATAEGKLKKQTGGHGQFAVAWLELSPLPRGKGFEFEDRIVGGVIPRNFIPAVEKGIVETMSRGVLAGYPVVDFKAAVYDGKHHTVDSSEIAFKVAASLGFKAAMQQAQPTILEPIMSLEIVVPDENMGDVIGDLNARRGRVLGVDSKGGHQIVKAHAPMAEVLKYAQSLTSITGGKGSFTLDFDHYEEAPAPVREKIIADAAAEKESKD